MPWRNPEKPTRSFKDCRDERRWWDRSAYKLPFRKFKGLDETALWGPLYQRFNTTPMPILDMEAWHADVVELMRKSATVKELYKHMEERKKKRFDELVTAINDMDGGVEWFCQPRSEDVKSLGMSLFHLWRDPSLFETARVFQTMTEIKEQARQECRRENRAWRKQYREKRQERRMKREQRKKERRERFSLEVDAISARLSPAQSYDSPPPADQIRAGENYMGDGKRKRSHQEQDAENGFKRKRRATTPSASPSETPKVLEASSSTGSPNSNAGSTSNNDGALNAGSSRKIKRDSQDSEAQSGREVKRRAGPPRTSPEKATSPRASPAISTSSDAGYVSNIESDFNTRRSRKRKCDPQDSEAESGREEKRRAVIPLASPLKEPTSLQVSPSVTPFTSDEGYDADDQSNFHARISGKRKLNNRKLIDRKLINRKLNNRKRDTRQRNNQDSETQGGKEEKLLSIPPPESLTEGTTNPGASPSTISTSSDEDYDSYDHGSFNGQISREMKLFDRNHKTLKRSHQDLDAESGHEGDLPAVSPRASPSEEPINSDALSSIISTSSDENDDSSDSDDNGNGNAISKKKTRGGYPTPPSRGSSQASGHAPYEDDFSGKGFSRPTRIYYEELGWVRDYGPADKELCSHEHEETQSTKPLTSGKGRCNMEEGL